MEDSKFRELSKALFGKILETELYEIYAQKDYLILMKNSTIPTGGGKGWTN